MGFLLTCTLYTVLTTAYCLGQYEPSYPSSISDNGQPLTRLVGVAEALVLDVVPTAAEDTELAAGLKHFAVLESTELLSVKEAKVCVGPSCCQLLS